MLNEEEIDALTLFRVYCRNHRCDDKDPIFRCRIKNSIGCNGGLCIDRPSEWCQGNAVLDDGVDLDTVYFMNILSRICLQSDCEGCRIRKLIGCRCRVPDTPDRWAPERILSREVSRHAQVR